MSFTDLGIVVLCAVIGWGIVSWIISVVQQQKQPPLDLSADTPRPAPNLPSPSPTAPIATISARWSDILGVSEDATAAQIDAAYHTGIAECDRIRFSAAQSPAAKSAADVRRAQITQAFEFIRPLKR